MKQSLILDSPWHCPLALIVYKHPFFSSRTSASPLLWAGGGLPSQGGLRTLFLALGWPTCPGAQPVRGPTPGGDSCFRLQGAGQLSQPVTWFPHPLPQG